MLALIYKTIPDGEQSENIILDRYEFRNEKRSSTKLFWRCIRNSCKAKFATFDDIVEIKERIYHDHQPTFNGSLDECSVEIIEIRLDPAVKEAEGKQDLMKNGNESESSTGKPKNADKPPKAEPEIVVMGMDSLRGPRFARKKRESLKYSGFSMERRQFSRRSDSSPQPRGNVGASSKEGGKHIARRGSSGIVDARAMKKKYYG